jgi:hypothetical protein
MAWARQAYVCCIADCRFVSSLQYMNDLCYVLFYDYSCGFLYQQLRLKIYVDSFGWFLSTEQWTLLSKTNVPSLWNYVSTCFWGFISNSVICILLVTEMILLDLYLKALPDDNVELVADPRYIFW